VLSATAPAALGGGGAEIRRLDGVHDLLALHRLNPGRYPHLLESIAHGNHARYDILFAFPGHRLQLAHPGEADFLGALDNAWRQERVAHHKHPALPFRGGWFLYLGYELAAQIEPRLRLARAGLLPVACATRIPAAVIRDRDQRCSWLLAEPEMREVLDVMERDLQNTAAAPELPPAICHLEEEAPEHFLEAVAQVKRYILAGDVFQVNLSRTWRGRLAAADAYASLYAALRRRNPAPFAGLSTGHGTAILSSSPERLVRVRGDLIETRPIAGTRPRSAERSEDLRHSRELLAHPKERAEHVMLIDLGRNDLGRVCRPGSIRVDEMMSLESYAHVHHIVSNIQGRKRAEITPGQIIRAVFPGGTITGCPKVRCMEIIAELEHGARGPYTGSFGYLNRDGDLDLNILIRTLVVEGDHFSVRAGAGIVADSDPAAELAETRAKARGLLLAVSGDAGG